MQTDAAGSHSDGNSSNSAFFSLGYSDLFDKQIQNHGTEGFPSPSALGEAMISFTRGHMSGRVADEFLNVHSGKDAFRDFAIGSSYHQVNSIHAMEPVGRYATFESCEKLATSAPFICNSSSSCMFESTNYSFDQGSLPFVGGVIGRAEVQPVGNSIPNEWILRQEEDINPGPSRFSKELSLSLATSQPSVVHGAPIQEQRSEMSCSGVALHKRQIGSDNTSCSSNSLSLNFNSYKPPMLSGSRFFHGMQEILAEIAYYALENFDHKSYSASGIDHDVSFSSSCSRNGFSDGLDSDHGSMCHSNLLHKRDVESKRKHLLSLLQVVDDQYNQCLDEIHTVVSAFHAVTELDPNLHARFALPTISLMYRNLRERISSHILAMGENPSEEETRVDNSFETSFIQKQWALQQLRKRDHQLWRPQRGLPERSVSVLKAWMFQNFLHPYPKDAEKHLLALKSGLTRSQVSNWFINARVRLWKPMIEEMYAEMNRRKARRNEEETNVTLRNHMRFENGRLTMD